VIKSRRRSNTKSSNTTQDPSSLNLLWKRWSRTKKRPEEGAKIKSHPSSCPSHDRMRINRIESKNRIESNRISSIHTVLVLPTIYSFSVSWMSESINQSINQSTNQPTNQFGSDYYWRALSTRTTPIIANRYLFIHSRKSAGSRVLGPCHLCDLERRAKIES